MGLFDKMFSGLSKTRKNMVELEELFQDYASDSEEFYEDLEELLVMADVGAATAQQVDYLMHKATWVERYRKGSEAREGLIRVLTKLLDVGSTELKLETKPSVILMVGVNGVGSSLASGRNAPGRTLSATKREATPALWYTTASAPPRPEAPT